MESTQTYSCYSGTPPHCYRNHVYGLTSDVMFPTYYYASRWLSSVAGSHGSEYKLSFGRVYDNSGLGTVCPSSHLFLDHHSVRNRPVRLDFLANLEFHRIPSHSLTVGRIWWINHRAEKLLGQRIQKTYRRAISLL
jgi:hypothetical protein